MRLFAFFLLLGSTNAFSVKSNLGPAIQRMSAGVQQSFDGAPEKSSRRDFLVGAGMCLGSLGFCQPAAAIPMVSVDELGVILRDSSLSIVVVEFSGPRSETVVVKLVDGTSFGIKDVIESSTDPRSPLKVAAACRENGVKTKFVDPENLLSSAPKKKKLYTNQRVQEAQEKEKARLERMQKDEEERLEQLRAMEQKDI